MHGLELAVAIYVALIAGALVVSVIADRIGVPYVVALLIISAPLDLFPEQEFGPTLLFVLLPALVFEAAWNVHASVLKRRWLPVLVLAVPGVLVTAGFVGGGLALTNRMPFLPALLLGAILAATDPIAVLAVFKRLSVPIDLATIVEGESLFNDGAAIVLYGVVLGTLVGSTETPTVLGIAWTAVSVSLGGAVIGLVVAALIALLLRGNDSVPLQITGTAVAAFGAYLLAEAAHVSGIFAAVVAGITLRVFPRFPSADGVVEANGFWGVVAFIANVLVFVLMGFRIEFRRILHDLPLVLLTLAFVTLARLLISYVVLPAATRGIPLAWRSVIALSGMRGAISVALAIGLPANTPFRSDVIDAVYGVVLITLVAQGLTIEPIITRLSLERKPNVPAMPSIATPV